MEDNNIYDDEEEVIHISELFKACFKYKKIFVKWIAIGFVIGFVISLGIPKVYSSEAVVVPEVFKRNISGSISSLASLAGINLNSMGGTSDAITYESYPHIIKSNPFVYDLSNTIVEFNYEDQIVSTTLYDYMDNYNKSSWWSYPLQVPGMIISLFKSEDEKPEAIKDSINFTREQEIIAASLRKSIDIKVDKKTQIITITTKFQNPVVAAKVCETVVELIKKYVTKYRTQKARNTLTYFEKIYKETQQAYYETQCAYAKYVDSNQDVLKRSRQLEEEKLRNEMQLCYNMYMTCSSELRNAKAAVQNETPVLAVVKPAAIPNKKKSPSKMKYGLVFAFLAFLSVSFWVVFIKEKVIKL